VIVLDASATIELLGRTPEGERVADRIARARSLHAPHLLDVEVAQVVRRRCAAGLVPLQRGREMFEDFRDLPIKRHEHFTLMGRIWELRHNFTAYDACYIALAELLNATLLTRDAAMVLLKVHNAQVELI
jgi:predicted nucleic acid-binding protein